MTERENTGVKVVSRRVTKIEELGHTLKGWIELVMSDGSTKTIGPFVFANC
jgi:hypothetical protein